MRICIVVAFSATALVLVGSAWAAPAQAVLKVGQSRAFTAASLPAGATVRCVNDGHTLSLSNPRNASPWLAQGTVWTKPGTRAFHLYLSVKPGGGYVASCGRGGSHY